MSTWDPTKQNINSVRRQIMAKNNGEKPFLASQQAVNFTITDQDTFPYPRFFRGITSSSEPVIFEREAGWRRRKDACYVPTRIYEVEIPAFCWQVPCSTTLPCKEVDVSPQETGCVYISP